MLAKCSSFFYIYEYKPMEARDSKNHPSVTSN